MAKAFIDDTNLTDIADAIRATLDESRQYLPSEMAAAIDSIPIMAQLNRKKYFQSVPSGAASGYATIEKIEGNTVIWNQLMIANPTPYYYSSSCYYTGIRSFTKNHKFYISFKYTTTSNYISNYVSVGLSRLGDTYGGTSTLYGIQPGVTKRASVIITSNNSYNNTVRFAYTSNYGTHSFVASEINVIDLTFLGIDNLTTIAQVEAWLAQNIGTLPYYDYNAGELLSVKMSGMQTEDSSQQTLDTLALDVTTITGINTATNVRETIFPTGMKQADRAGTVKDELDLLSDKATVNVGSRAYQSGDESDPDVLTDGTTTYYALNTPIEYTDLQDQYGNPLNPRYKVEQGGTEQVLPANTSTPTTVAPTLTTTYTKDNN